MADRNKRKATTEIESKQKTKGTMVVAPHISVIAEVPMSELTAQRHSSGRLQMAVCCLRSPISTPKKQAQRGRCETTLEADGTSESIPHPTEQGWLQAKKLTTDKDGYYVKGDNLLRRHLLINIYTHSIGVPIYSKQL